MEGIVHRGDGQWVHGLASTRCPAKSFTHMSSGHPPIALSEIGPVGSQFTDENTEAGMDLVRDGQRGQR